VDRLRESQIWSAKTTKIILERQTDSDSVGRTDLEKIRGAISQSLKGHLRPEEKVDRDMDIDRILHPALDLNREISRQIARVHWIFGEAGPLRFNPDTMEIKSCETIPPEGQPVRLVVVPSLMKKGKSTADDLTSCKWSCVWRFLVCMEKLGSIKLVFRYRERMNRVCL
jgi:hypothetical protein